MAWNVSFQEMCYLITNIVVIPYLVLPQPKKIMEAVPANEQCGNLVPIAIM